MDNRKQAQLWLKIPGTVECEFLPFVRPLETLCSNTILIRTPRYLIVMDPGSMPEETDKLLPVLHEAGEADKPVLIILTHCHWDHSRQARRLASALGPRALVLAQEEARLAFQRGDNQTTQYALFEDSVRDMSVDAILLTSEPQKSDPGLPLEEVEMKGADGAPLRCQKLALGEDDALMFMHTPGHSPDSICMKLGRLLFAGDTPFAANPSVAGIAGWDQKNTVRSVTTIIQWLKSGDFEACWTGHGPGMPASVAVKILNRTLDETTRLENLIQFNTDRMKVLNRYARAALDETAEMLSLISGRLYSLSYHLENLEEASFAEKVLKALNLDAMDALLADFQKFLDEFENNRIFPYFMPLRVFQILKKMERQFLEGDLKGFMDPRLPARTLRMIGDFIRSMRGMRLTDTALASDPALAIEAFAAGWRSAKYGTDDILNSTEDAEAFAAELAMRMAMHDPVGRPPLTMKLENEGRKCAMDQERLTDILWDAAERFAAHGSEGILLTARSGAGHVAVEISAGISGLRDILGARLMNYLTAELNEFGGTVTIARNASGEALIIEIPAADPAA